MVYRVELTTRATRDLEAIFLVKNAAESRSAARWYNRLEEAVNSLEAFPHRGPLITESRRMKRKLRHLLYGKSPHVYRVIYEVDEDRRVVSVLTIRHGARKEIRVSDLD